jgi:hypothetical protein
MNVQSGKSLLCSVYKPFTDTREVLWFICKPVSGIRIMIMGALLLLSRSYGDVEMGLVHGDVSCHVMEHMWGTIGQTETGYTRNLCVYLSVVNLRSRITRRYSV